MSSEELVADVRHNLVDVADPGKVDPMVAYMKDQFPFLGVRAADRRAAQRSALTALRDGDGDDLVDFARACWAEAERELQYVGADALRKHAAKLEPVHLPAIEALITTKSWWDTVDSLAVHTVGPLVATHPELATVMDEWIDDDNMWLARTAILHQLSYKERTDAARLFGYADKRADNTEFFIRKALGWALRQHARVDPDAVRAYVEANDNKLSGLTKREALKHLK